MSQEVTDSAPAHKDLALAQALERWETVRAGLAGGRFSTEHARIITHTLDAPHPPA